ncbi:fimbria/pilus periplasmic chaperone [Bdellovibrio bacteriovorus]|uniref:fimbria/pilus periplasmic chaperone n=1 Tax=Bdellovibrio bacteriovorus TaxID=959 RepID=UPI0021D3D510|nr:fimbria/pilus periplasmic chaperone [Bdellovibrio bacteriovorus]UXR65554.1 fimbria/pilus periplasmic chaperone [Bdellovibrio bacteriovorus]
MAKIILRSAFVFLLLPSLAWAFRFSPMVVEFTPSGSRSTQVLIVENPGDEKLPVQIEAFARHTGKGGEEIRTKTEDFAIYPEQVVLLPKEKRNVRVSWSGKITDGKEKAYRLVASQLPVDFREKNSAPKKTSVNLKFLLQYVASAYVTPEGAEPRVIVKQVKKAGPRKVSVTFANEGTAHRVLLFKSLKIKASQNVLLELTGKKEIESINLLPGDTAAVELETTKEVPANQELKAELTLKESDN